MMRAWAALLLLLAGCARAPSVADCGLAIHAPARALDAGVRFDLQEVVGDSLDPRPINYTIHRSDAQGLPVAFAGNVADLMASGSGTVRYLDARNDSLVNVGDAIVVGQAGPLLLRFLRGANIVGSSAGCS